MGLTRRLLPSLVALAVLLLGGCSGKDVDSSPPEDAVVSATSEGPAAEPAPALPMGRILEGQVTTAALQPGQSHVFSVAREAGQWVRAFVRPDPDREIPPSETDEGDEGDEPEGDFTLRLLDENGRELSSVDEMWPGEEEQLVYPARETSTFRLEVSGDTVPYQLWVEGAAEPSREVELWAEAQALDRRGTQVGRDDTPEAVRQLLAAAEIWNTLGRDARSARVLEIAAGLLKEGSEWEPSIEIWGRAAELRTALDHAPAAAAARNNRGSALRRLGRRGEAEQEFRRALELSRDPGDPYEKGEIAALNNLALAAYSRGVFDEAQEHYEAAIELSRTVKDPKQHAQVLINSARLHLVQGRVAISEQLVDEALALYHRAGLDPIRARLLQAWVYTVVDRPTEAVDIFESIIDRFKKPGSRSLAVHHQMALAYEKAGRSQEARRSAEYAAQIMRSKALHRESLGLLTDLCRWSLQDRADDHVDVCRQSVEMARKSRRPGPLVVALWQQARSDRLDQRPRDAWSRLQEALDKLQELRSGIAGAATRAQFLADHAEVFSDAVDLAMELDGIFPEEGFARRALETSELLRVPGLADRLGLLTEPLRTAEPDVRREYELRQKELEELKKLLENAQPLEDRPDVEAPVLDQRIRQVFAELDILEGRALAAGQGLSWVVPREDDNLIESLQSQLDDDTAVLSLMMGPERSYLWMLTREGLESRTLVSRTVLEATARRYVKALDGRSSALDTHARQLAEALFLEDGSHLDPVRDKRRLIFVADGLLQQIPLSALPIRRDAVEAEPLIRHFEVIHAPSLAVMKALRERPANKWKGGLAVFGDPFYLAKNFPDDHTRITEEELRRHFPAVRPTESLVRLPFADVEIRNIARYFEQDRTLLATGPRAARERFLSEDLSTYEVLHFASHAVVEPDHPELSGFLLSEIDVSGQELQNATRLNLYDISHLQLSAELVVAGACETAVGDTEKLGVTALAQGFLQAGARRVVASLWKVETESTANLMDRFYHFMIEEKLPPGEALRRAKLHLLDSGLGQFYWAPFVLYGDWKPLEAKVELDPPSRR